MSNIKLEDLKEGMLVKLKTEEQLKATGWQFEFHAYVHEQSDCGIVRSMFEYLGNTYKIDEIDKDGTFYLEDIADWSWDVLMVESIRVYPEQPQEESVPYFGAKSNTSSPVIWDKQAIQCTFNELEMYDKGYMDGFERAIELMKNKFGVEL